MRLRSFVLVALLSTLLIPIPAKADPCPGMQELPGTGGMCTHGGDRFPGSSRPPSYVPPSGFRTMAIACDGDGATGKRVQAIYARTASRADASSTVIPQIRSWASSIDAIFSNSSGGARRPRWVTSADCALDIKHVVVSDASDSSFSSMITSLQNQGYNRADRKYLIWYDTASQGICGIASMWYDESAGATNLSNSRTGYARTDRRCWGYGGQIEAHELTHTLGAVQNGAPNSTSKQNSGGHCSDEYDVMCYVDKAGVVMTIACPDKAGEALLDCNDNDYFSVNPPAGSYLATHWNTANSGWLTTGGSAPPPPPPPPPPAGPNLVAGWPVAATQTCSSYGTCTLRGTVRITNTGTANAGRFAVTISYKGVVVRTITVSRLYAGRAASYRISLRHTGTWAGTVTATADAHGAIAETNETDNTASATVV